MCQDCLTAALPILPSLCLLSHFLANNGNGRMPLEGYFMHQLNVIQHLWRWRALIFTEAQSAEVNMSAEVVYIGYGPPYRTTYNILYGECATG